MRRPYGRLAAAASSRMDEAEIYATPRPLLQEARRRVAGPLTRPWDPPCARAPREAGPPHRLRDRWISLGQWRISLAQSHENSRNLRPTYFGPYYRKRGRFSGISCLFSTTPALLAMQKVVVRVPSAASGSDASAHGRSHEPLAREGSRAPRGGHEDGQAPRPPDWVSRHQGPRSRDPQRDDRMISDDRTN